MTSAPSGPSESIGDRVLRRCRELGFALAGVAPAQPPVRWSDLCAWLEAGKHGSMDYLRRQADPRADPSAVLPGARTIVMVADQYASRSAGGEGHAPGQHAPADPARSGHGRVARYAWGQDYHRVVKDRLHVLCDELRADHPGELFRAFADTAPVMERDFAAAAGIGWIGKNTLIINPRLGSWLVLGGFLTTMAIEPPPAQGVVPDHCGTCTRCIDACPTGAITPYSVDARRCISYLTIERRSDVDPLLSPGVGDWVFGCDVCQEVCPHNSPRGEGFETGVPRREYSSRTPTLDLSEVLSWTMGDRSRVLGGSAIKRATLAMLKRNAIIAMGNGCRSGERAAVAERLASIARDEGEDVMVRRQAERTLSQWAGEPESPGRGGGGRLS